MQVILRNGNERQRLSPACLHRVSVTMLNTGFKSTFLAALGPLRRFAPQTKRARPDCCHHPSRHLYRAMNEQLILRTRLENCR